MTIRTIRSVLTASTAAVAIAALSTPQIAQAGTLAASATVAASSIVNSATGGTTTTWTGAAAQAVLFTLNITSNDTANGFTLAYTGANSTTGFALKGPGAGTTLVPYTIFNTATVPVQYAYNTAGAAIIPASTSAANYTFNINLPTQAAVVSGVYADTITYTITSL